jgi:uncharacterized protein
MANTKQFDAAKFLSIETYRKSGQAMPTAVWFAEINGAYYFQTQKNAGKVKRIRNNATVRIAPCTQSGAITGEWIAARAEIVTETPAALAAQTALAKKYGLMKRLFDLFSRRKGYDAVKISVDRPIP